MLGVACDNGLLPALVLFNLFKPAFYIWGIFTVFDNSWGVSQQNIDVINVNSLKKRR